MATEPKQDKERKKWLSRENLLMCVGLLLIAATFVTAEVGWAFHYEFLLAGMAFCGVSITSLGDRK